MVAQYVAGFVIAAALVALEILLRTVAVHVQVQVLAMTEALAAVFAAQVLHLSGIGSISFKAFVVPKPWSLTVALVKNFSQ